MTAVTGVSGAGKVYTVNDILYPALARQFHQSTLKVGLHEKNCESEKIGQSDGH